MGCSSSKDANEAVKPESKPRGTTDTATPSFEKKNTYRDKGGGFTQSVVMMNDKGEAKKNTATHLKNIFAAPLELEEGYQPPQFKKSEADETFIKEAMKTNFVFANLSGKEETTLVGAFEVISSKAGDTIIKQGDTGDFFYVIKEGNVRFEVNDKTVGYAKKGKSFGELSLLYTSPRAATCISEDDTTLFRVDQKTFRYIMQSTTTDADNSKRELIKKVEFLKDLTPSDMNKFLEVLTPRPFKKGEQLVKKGDQGKEFFIVSEGEVKVTDIEVGDSKFEDQTLTKGGHFGERALVTSEPRAANVVATTMGVCFTVDGETFNTVVGNLEILLTKATDKQCLKGIKSFGGEKLEEAEWDAICDCIVEKEYKTGNMILEEGDESIASIYLVRDGIVEISSNDGTFKGIYHKGSYFGDEQLSHNTKKDGVFVTKYTISVISDDAKIGVLSAEDVRGVVDSSKKENSTSSTSLSEMVEDIKFNELKRHRILGAGTFGQVWLCSRKNSKGEKVAYALKIQSKYELIHSQQAKGVVQERYIMSKLKSPFVVRLEATFQDPARVYILLKLIQGGEMLGLFENGGVGETNAKFYAGCILEGLSYMHRRSILYRDLKPENVLIGADGYPVLIDLGFAKVVKGKTFTLCGTPLYIAPEVVLNRGHDKGADHWSTGVLIYEMISGYTPFYEDGMDQLDLFKAITHGKFKYSPRIPYSQASRTLINGLLTTQAPKRLGSLAKGDRDIFKSAWFNGFDFGKLRRKELESPWKPDVKDPFDTKHFSNFSHLPDKGTEKSPNISKKDQKIFKDF
mmetsp:Transcript_16222/g.22866  ORF Transcript_16222/g.22866 Transcript_16222/m.22866 type:complete len:798 (-) Transcript_16222:62-2455(-)